MNLLQATLFAARFVHLATVLFLFGALAFTRYAGFSMAMTRPALRTGLRSASALALLSALAWFACVVVSLGDGYAALADPETLRAVLLDTAFGHAWALQNGLLLLLALRLTWQQRAEHSRGALLLAGVTLLIQAANGHPFAAAASSWQQGVHMLHLLAAGTWLGGLVPLLSVLRRDDAGLQPALPGVVRRFSWIALPAVLLLALSGLLNLDTLGLLSAPWQWTTYAWLLRGKLALFGVLLLLATYNRFVLTPQLELPERRRQALGRLQTTVMAEIGLGLLLLALVGALGMVAPG